MTEPTPFDDELLSAALDHELPADEMARLAEDPAAAARLERLAAARDAVRAAVDVPVGAVDRAVAAALAARVAARADTSELQAIPGALPPAGSEEVPAPGPRSVSSLDAARDRRRPILPVLGAAATVLLLAVAAVAVWSANRTTSSLDRVAAPAGPSTPAESETAGSGERSTGFATGAPDESADRRGGAPAGAVVEPEASNSTTTARPTTGPTDRADVTASADDAEVGTALGEFTEPDLLGQRARAVAPPAVRIDAMERQRADETSPCPTSPELGQILWWGTATLRGTPVVVQLLLLPTDALDLVAVDSATCSRVVDLSS